MKGFAFTLALAVAALAALPQSAACFDYRSYKEFSKVATETEHQGKWQQIHWLKDMEQAKARAKAENKPILVFLVIGFKGQAHAPDC